MESNHRIIIGDASEMTEIEDQSIDLVVTSPPYPMIEMWDGIFCSADPAIAKALTRCDGSQAFERMHAVLDRVWGELRRVMKPGGLACINIGDATRTIDENFQLFANHARIIAAFRELGFSQLPAILWRKPTNAPNKFMGSGMLPAGAYVTLEHEYILIFRLNGKRTFLSDDLKAARRQSAFFWEERNEWFSDVWFNLPGAPQGRNAVKSRERSGAFPLTLPYRLIQMFSLKGDRVLDPFLGTGTTMLAAMCSGRHCVGYEIDPGFKTVVLEQLGAVPEIANRLIERRLRDHVRFIEDRIQQKGPVRYSNRHYRFPVVTRQEMDLCLDPVHHIQFIDSDRFKVLHADPQMDVAVPEGTQPPQVTTAASRTVRKSRQLKLF
ncbi:MAG: site-specific DNA-methyltransferase [Desulfatitalea sp.]|nr:site-specific DNA-methyltransferase [Desulfatitalea sp.]